MDFQHTEDRRMLADSLNRFIAEQYGFDTRDKIARSAAGFSIDMWRRFAELGVIGALFDEAHGGYGGKGFDVAVVFESLGRGLVVEPFLDTLVVGRALAHAGSIAQQEKLFVGMLLILIFAEAIGLYGMILAIVMASQ